MYHPTGRVLTVLELLQTRPGMSGSDLANRLETDVRTIRRYIAKLQDVGIPIESVPGRYGGYRLRPGYKLPPLIFSPEEAVAVVLGLLGTAWLELGQSQAAVDGALSKITRVMPAETRRIVEAMSANLFITPSRSAVPPDATLLLSLSEAAQLRECLRMEYRSRAEETTIRTVEPYGVAGRAGYWYLIAYCRMRKDFRTFRLDRIIHTERLEDRFERDETFDYRSYARLEHQPSAWIFRLLFTANMDTVRNHVSPTYGVLTETPEGVVFEGPADDLEYAAMYLLAIALPFTVLEPPELKDVLNRYAMRARFAAGDNS